MGFFSRYVWSAQAKLFCGIFIVVGLMSASNRRPLGWLYLFVGLFCAWAWKRPKADHDAT